MALSALADRHHQPDDRALAEVLGRAAPLWTGLKDRLQSAFGPLVEEWGFSSAAAGWSFRLKDAARVLVYMTPCRGHFLASFALGEKACAEAHARGLPTAVLAIVDAAPKYPEGRGLRIPVRTRADVAHVESLLAVRVAMTARRRARP